ncbi:protein MAINTENANCE OF MERISTEMS-like [Rhododendron vialii]|uniref:protein MAINTENANCE OF MERISTEMS-like n=1 Tax=Rhododendron vialii TaxID=182163 RepID=UPI00265FC1B6|nr:protein MAINTENANCE OF MERISTEMS-like [Rhododendron vialii]
MEVVGDGERRTPRVVGRTPAVVETGGPRVRRLDSRSEVEGLVIAGVGSVGVRSSGNGGGCGGDQLETSSRDPARGKDSVVMEETSGEMPVGVAKFRLAVGSSAHVLITRGDFAEFVTEEELGRLLRENPERGATSTRGHGGPARSLELYKELPERVRALVDAAGFKPFILTLTAVKSDHALLTALAERWWDSSNTFHFPIGEMIVTSLDFAALTGLRVGGEPIPFDSGIHRDTEALGWFLGQVPKGGAETVHYEQFKRYLQRRVSVSEQEVEQMARAYLLYLFGATLYLNKRATMHLSYLPALRNLHTASRYNWGGTTFGVCYGFMGEFSRGKKATTGYWRVWELWAYEVLKMYPLENKCPDLRMLPRAMIWGPLHRGKKKSRGSLLAFRSYLDELSGIQVEWNPWSNVEPEPEYLARSRVVIVSRVLLESAFGWQWYLGDRVTRQSLGFLEYQAPRPLPSRASHTNRYTLAELRHFTIPEGFAAFLRPERDYAVYRRQYLARPLGVLEHKAVESEALEAGEER